MSKEGTAEPDPVTDPADPAQRLDSFRAIGQPGDTPAPDSWRNAMLDRFGLAASVLVHLCLVFWAIGWLASAEPPAEEDVIPVTLVPEEETKPPPPSPPENPSQENPSRESNPSAASKLTDEQQRAEIEADARDAVGDRHRQPQGEAGSPSPPLPADLSDLLTSLGMASYSRQTTLSREELDAVKAQAQRCWKIPEGWTEPQQISVTIRFQLNPDGSIKGSPSVVAFPASELGKAAAINAMSAVAQCGPFKLPADKYDQWKDIQLRFEP